MIQDVTIIGGSFAGLSAAMQLARAQRLVTVIDANEPRNRFAAASHGFFGLDGFSPQEIRSRALSQLKKYPTVSIIEGRAADAEKQGSGFSVAVKNGETVCSTKLILATGLRDELPEVPGVNVRWGKTVNHCPYCHGFELRNRPLGVIATGEMSAHQAELIPDWGPTTFFTQGIYFPDDEQRAFLAKRGVTIENSPVVSVLGDAPDINAVELEDGRKIELGGIYIVPKTHMASNIALNLGCELIGKAIVTDDFKQTSVPGVYAAGDIANPMQNATFASASGVMAGVGAHHALIQGT